MSILISGGCKNGKTMYAQKLAKKMAEELKVPLYYFATMRPKDNEDLQRIENHIKERDGWGFVTIEQEKNILERIGEIHENGVVLFDSLTAVLENTMFNKDFTINEDELKKLEKDILDFAKKCKNTIFISDNIFCDGKIYDEITEIYRSKLAKLDKIVGKVADNVIEISFGRVVIFK